MVRVPLPMAEVWAEMQAQVEELTGQAELQILRAILENEVTHRVFHCFFAPKPVRSESNKQFGSQVLSMVLLGTRGPQLFREEPFGFSIAVIQSPFPALPCFLIEKSDLLKARVIICGYISMSGFFLPSLWRR
jgi:hypothetical protein